MSNIRAWTVCLLGGFILLLPEGHRAETNAGQPAPAKVKEAPRDGKARLRGLLKERLGTAREMARQVAAAFKAGTASYSRVHQANLAVLEAELDLAETPKARVAVRERFVAAMKEVEERVRQQQKAAVVPASALLEAKLRRLEAEIALEREKIRAADPSK
jgi:flagellar hook-basal body complex protein FliE